MSERDLKNAIEFIPNRLYYVPLTQRPAVSAAASLHFFTMDHELLYWNFFLDFGPLNLGQLYRFCERLNAKLSDPRLQDKVIYYFSGSHAHQRTNAAYLISSWALLYMGRDPEDAFRPFRTVQSTFPSFHDATPGPCTYQLGILDCLRGIARAREHGFFNFDDFDIQEYEHFEQVENGDLNWIVQGRFVAFAGPHNRKETTAEGYHTMVPEDYIPHFKKKDVRLVVRLNQKYYDETKFTSAGIEHMELYYLDGSTPSDAILRRFLTKAESVDGAIAVHCKAGLGRTGTCIGCYLMKHFRLTAAETIGWLRVCRPGSVIGPQQHYMRDMESRLWQEGEMYRARLMPIPSSPIVKPMDVEHKSEGFETDSSPAVGMEVVEPQSQSVLIKMLTTVEVNTSTDAFGTRSTTSTRTKTRLMSSQTPRTQGDVLLSRRAAASAAATSRPKLPSVDAPAGNRDSLTSTSTSTSSSSASTASITGRRFVEFLNWR